MFQPKEQIVIYDLKNVLSTGRIVKRAAGVSRDDLESGGLLDVVCTGNKWFGTYRYSHDWKTKKMHRDFALTEEQALEMAEEIRSDRIKSLEKSIAKTKKRVFKVEKEEE